MNVLIINSSPRKDGNCDILCQQFAKGAIEAGSEVVSIRLSTLQIAPCKACTACSKTHRCIIEDDMASVFASMQNADVIVLATPVYFYSLSAQLKTMIDRCFVDHKSLTGKRFYFIVTAADPRREAADNTIDSMRGFLRCLPDAEEEGIIYGTGCWDKGDVYRHPAYNEAYEKGKGI